MANGDDDLRSKLIVLYKDQADMNVSSLSLGDQSYILDLAHQKEYRKERRKEEAMDDALGLYKAALEEGAPKTVELFKTILAEVLAELKEEYREKDRLQDEWLDEALQAELDRKQKEKNAVTGNDATSKEEGGRPTPPPLLRRKTSARMLELDQKIHDEDRKILEKKVKKAEKIMKDIINKKGAVAGKATKRYKRLKKKVKEYRATLEEDANKKKTMDATGHTKTSSSAMYDWGAVSTHTDKVADDNSSSSSGSSSRSFGNDDDASDVDDDDNAWAKNIVSKLTIGDSISDNNDLNNLTSTEQLSPSKSRPKPQKSSSMKTNMATRRGVATQRSKPNGSKKATTKKKKKATLVLPF